MATSTNYAKWSGFGGGSGGGGGGGAIAAGVVNLAQGQSSFVVTYDTTIASIPPLFSVANTVDTFPIFLNGIITAFSGTGFTITFNAQTDTANYKLSYAVMAGV